MQQRGIVQDLLSVRIASRRGNREPPSDLPMKKQGTNRSREEEEEEEEEDKHTWWPRLLKLRRLLIGRREREKKEGEDNKTEWEK